MAENSKIEWTDHTFNPWTGCTKVSPGCDGCYAEAWAKRSGTVAWGTGEPRRRTTDANWRLPLKWNAQAEREGRRFRVFCASLADVFDNEVPTAWRVDLLRLIEATPHLDWLLLTKRIGNVERMLDEAARLMPEVLMWPLPNVWLGATVVNQAEADRDIPKLLGVPARIRFLSIEPMLGPIKMDQRLIAPIEGTSQHGQRFVDWIIAGGESGPHARPAHPNWFRSLRDQCAVAGVPFLFKQWGEWGPTWFEAHAHLGFGAPKDPAGELSIAGTRVIVGPLRNGDVLEQLWPIQRHGKKAAGRLLDGVEHNGVPR
ncbi:MAG: phage Gp37/Gp68 family protein [Burkholderiales bacterium]|nr:phage Gp37/Gp68 family protein [Burkholderiales bacterium]